MHAGLHEDYGSKPPTTEEIVCVCVSGIPYIMSCHKNSNKVLFDLVGTFFVLHYENSV